ncbi:lipocalin-like domain-containing protein [Marinobacter sp. C2H3]|uniref:lipocalin-like domain-containing protein n=1 Tax=Marinobacter sp. C2H3 TaxID=3119003 RepID=UPI003FA599CC
MVALWSLVLALLAGCSGDDGASGPGLAPTLSGGDAGGFLQPGPDTGLRFPADFGPHPRYRVEWWYLTANLTTAEGEPLGVQWTQFRQGFRPRSPDQAPPPADQWPLEAAWMAHGAVSYQGQHRFEERLARGDVGSAGAVAEPFEVWLDDWQLQQVAPRRWHLTVRSRQAEPGFGYDLTLTLNRPPVPQGDHGFSAKSASGQGSMYFSLVDIRIEGTVTLDGKRLQVAGQGWFDREWSSQFLKQGQQGWDWFAQHLDDGDKLMAFRLRDAAEPFVSGTWIPAGGDPQPLTDAELTLTPLERRDGYPVRWRLQVPSEGVDIEVTAPPGRYVNDGRFPYWESPVRVSGNRAGVGYMELTGYGATDD